MKFPDFEYVRPRDLEAALELLSDAERDAHVLAGGQSLLPMMAFRMARPAVLVDISRLDVLRSVSPAAAGDVARIGAAVTHAEIEDGAVSGALGVFLARVASGIAYRAVRNRGTLGGSLAQADPSADWPIVFAALEARLQLRSAEGTRDLPARQFSTGSLETALKPGEVIVAFEIDPPTQPIGFAKSVRKLGEYAEALAVAVLHRDRAEVWLGVIAGRPVTITLDVAAAAIGETRLLSSGAYRDVAAAVGAVAETLDDYSIHLAATVACRAMADALTHAGMSR